MKILFVSMLFALIAVVFPKDFNWILPSQLTGKMKTLFPCTKGTKKKLSSSSSYILESNRYLMKTSLVYTIYMNETLCCGSVESISRVILPKLNWSELNDIVVYAQNKQSPIPGETYKIKSVIKTLSFGNDTDLIKLAKNLNYDWPIDHPDSLLYPMKQVEAKRQVYGVGLDQDMTAVLKEFVVKYVTVKTIIVQKIKDGKIPECLGEPLFYKNKVVGLFLEPFSEEDCFSYSRFI